MNQADVSNTNSIFTAPNTLVNHGEDQPEKDFNRAFENEFINKKIFFVQALKQQQQQQKQIPQWQQPFSTHKTTLVEKEQLTELIRMHPYMSNIKSKAYRDTG